MPEEKPLKPGIHHFEEDGECRFPKGVSVSAGDTVKSHHEDDCPNKPLKPSELPPIKKNGLCADDLFEGVKKMAEAREQYYKTLKPSELVRTYVNDSSWRAGGFLNDMERMEEEQRMFNDKLLEILDEMQENIDKLSE